MPPQRIQTSFTFQSFSSAEEILALEKIQDYLKGLRKIKAAVDSGVVDVKIPRILNTWFLMRKVFKVPVEALSAFNDSLSSNDRQVWEQAAHLLEQEFRDIFPRYKYSPKPRPRAKRDITKSKPGKGKAVPSTRTTQHIPQIITSDSSDELIKSEPSASSSKFPDFPNDFGPPLSFPSTSSPQSLNGEVTFSSPEDVLEFPTWQPEATYCRQLRGGEVAQSDCTSIALPADDFGVGEPLVSSLTPSPPSMSYTQPATLPRALVLTSPALNDNASTIDNLNNTYQRIKPWSPCYPVQLGRSYLPSPPLSDDDVAFVPIAKAGAQGSPNTVTEDYRHQENTASGPDPLTDFCDPDWLTGFDETSFLPQPGFSGMKTVGQEIGGVYSQLILNDFDCNTSANYPLSFNHYPSPSSDDELSLDSIQPPSDFIWPDFEIWSGSIVGQDSSSTAS